MLPFDCVHQWTANADSDNEAKHFHVNYTDYLISIIAYALTNHRLLRSEGRTASGRVKGKWRRILHRLGIGKIRLWIPTVPNYNVLEISEAL